MRPYSGIGGARDVRAATEKAARGGVLTPSELLDIAATIQAGRELRQVLSRLALLLPLLHAISQRIDDLSNLSAEITHAINAHAEVNDHASPALLEIRRQIRTAHDRLQQRLQEFINSPLARQVLQEPIVTLRDGRYVVPVKADFRSAVPGIVHDVSQSGATVFVEPLAVVELTNRWRELQAEEKHEVERILRRLSSLVGNSASNILETVQALAEIDLTMAKARFGVALGANELPGEGEHQPWIAPSPAPLHLFQARHPLLTGHVVPIDLHVGGTYRILLITGPNTGGKTVALKTAGLLALMAQAGLPIPAERGSQLPVFDNVFADIGDEQSIEQSLSTFSSHMRNIISIVQEATPKSLVLLDELAAGTDPVEGAALARAILIHLLSVGCLTIATTHHGALKSFAHQTPGVMNASVEFDPETLAPTYRLRIGLPGRSNAVAIARRLGLPESILQAAQEALPPEQVEIENLLAELQRERDEAAAARRAEEQARQEAEEIRARLAERLEAFEDTRDQLLSEAEAEATRAIEAVRMHLREAERRLERVQRAEELREAAAAITAAEEELARAKRRRPRRRRRLKVGPAPTEVRPGDRVWLRGLGRAGEAITSPDERGEIEVTLGPLRTRVRVDQIERVERSIGRQPASERVVTAPPPPTVPLEIEIRGQTLDEALPKVERYLDDAFRAGLPWVRIIHGKGTGTLRQAIRDLLARHPLVRHFEFADPREGGEGVTVAHFIA